MNRAALFNQAELAVAFSLILPDDVAREVAQEWFADFAAEDDVNVAGYYLAPEVIEDDSWVEEPAILAHSDSLIAASEEEHLNLHGMTVDEKRRWLLSFSDLHLGLLALSSPQVSDRIRLHFLYSDEVADQRHRHMQRVVRALNT